MRQMTLKHHNSRRGVKPNAIILHYPSPNLAHEKPYSVEAIYENLNKHKLSYHFYVDVEGNITQFVPCHRRAWHAGRGILWGQDDPNTWSIGVCLENNGGIPYQPTQIDSVGHFCAFLCREYNIPLNRVVGHEHVSPKRKSDPGKKFPWMTFFMRVGKGISHPHQELYKFYKNIIL